MPGIGIGISPIFKRPKGVAVPPTEFMWGPTNGTQRWGDDPGEKTWGFNMYDTEAQANNDQLFGPHVSAAGLAVNDLIYYNSSTQGGLIQGTFYYIVYYNNGNFQIGLTLGGDPVDITSNLNGLIFLT